MEELDNKALKEAFINGRGVWTSGWEDLLTLDPHMFDQFLRMRDVPQRRSQLSPKVQEFIHIAVHATATTVYSPAVREHVKSALAVGATVREVMEVIGLTSLVGVHTITQGTPILMELLEEEGMQSHLPLKSNDKRREQIKQDFIKARGFWTDTWNPILALDPDFFEAYMQFSSLPSRRNVLEPKVRELIYTAFDVATTHLYARGTKIHMRNAIRLGATPGEIMEMLELVSFVGMNGVVNGASIVAQELQENLRRSHRGHKRALEDDDKTKDISTNGKPESTSPRESKRNKNGGPPT